jgi:uncharacterized membrane protein
MVANALSSRSAILRVDQPTLVRPSVRLLYSGLAGSNVSTLVAQTSTSTPPVARWAVVTTFLLSLTGLGLSTYMTIAHFTMPTILACSGTGELSCTKVTTSPESYALGIPVVILGLGYFTVMSILNWPRVWRRPERWLAIFRLTLSVVGMIFVLWLVAAEILIIGHVCLWCTGVHLDTLALLIILTRVTPAQLGWLQSFD